MIKPDVGFVVSTLDHPTSDSRPTFSSNRGRFSNQAHHFVFWTILSIFCFFNWATILHADELGSDAGNPISDDLANEIPDDAALIKAIQDYFKTLPMIWNPVLGREPAGSRLPPVQAVVVAGMLSLLDIEAKGVWGKSRKHPKTIENITKKSNRDYERLMALISIVQIYANRQGPPANLKISSLEQWIGLTEPTYPRYSDTDRHMQDLESRLQDRTLGASPPLEIEGVYSDPQYFADRETFNQVNSYESMRRARPAYLMSDQANFAGTRISLTMLAAIISGISQALSTSAVGAASAAEITANLEEHLIERSQNHRNRAGESLIQKNGTISYADVDPKKVQELIDPPQKNQLPSPQRLRDGASLIRGVMNAGNSEEELIDFFTKLHSVIKDDPQSRVLVDSIVRNVSESITSAFMEAIRQLPAQYAHQVGGMDKERLEELQAYARFVFETYPAHCISSEDLKSLINDLVNMDPRTPPAEVIQLLAARLGPMAKNAAQLAKGMSGNGESPFEENMETLQSRDRGDTAHEVSITVMEDHTYRDLIVTGYIDLDDKEALQVLLEESRRTDLVEGGTPILFNLDFQPARAGKAMQVIFGMGALNGEVFPVAVRVAKVGAKVQMEFEARNFINITGPLQALFGVFMGQTAHKQMIDHFFANVAEPRIAMEQNLEATVAAQRVAALRYSRDTTLEVNGQRVAVKLRVPRPFPVGKAATVQPMERVHGLVSFKDLNDRAGVSKSVAEAIGATILKAFMEELVFHPLLKEHPLVAATRQWAESRNLRIDFDKFEVYSLARSGGDFGKKVDSSSIEFDPRDVGYELKDINTLAKHLDLIQKARLSDGFAHYDPHAGNFLIVEPVTLSDGTIEVTVHITDHGMSSFASHKHLDQIALLIVGAQQKDAKLVTKALSQLALDKIDKTPAAGTIARLRDGFRKHAPVLSEAEIEGFLKGLFAKFNIIGPSDVLQVVAFYKGLKLTPEILGLFQPLAAISGLMVQASVSTTTQDMIENDLQTKFGRTLMRIAGDHGGLKYKFANYFCNGIFGSE